MNLTPKTVLVNARFLLKDKLEGIGWFTHETLSRITKSHPECRFIFAFDRPYDNSFVYGDNVIPVVIPPPARHPFLWYLWFEWSIPYLINKYKPDLFLSTDGYLSLKSKTPTCLVVHDIAFEHFPTGISKLKTAYYKHYTPKFVHHASRVATVSEFTKNDLVGKYGISTEKIDVVYNGANESYKPVSIEKQLITRKTLTNGAPYFLFVGAMHPRKNIVNLLKAFDRFKEQYTQGFKLVIVGRKGWGTTEIESTFSTMHHKSDVILTGMLPVDDLSNIIGSAHAMVYIPLFEGFGIPILESQFADVPVITSNTSSMPEVSGNSACLVDPYSVEDIANKMITIAQNDQFRSQLIELGKTNRTRFSWNKTSELLWESMIHAYQTRR